MAYTGYTEDITGELSEWERKLSRQKLMMHIHQKLQEAGFFTRRGLKVNEPMTVTSYGNPKGIAFPDSDYSEEYYRKDAGKASLKKAGFEVLEEVPAKSGWKMFRVSYPAKKKTTKKPASKKTTKKPASKKTAKKSVSKKKTTPKKKCAVPGAVVKVKSYTRKCPTKKKTKK